MKDCSIEIGGYTVSNALFPCACSCITDKARQLAARLDGAAVLFKRAKKKKGEGQKINSEVLRHVTRLL